MSSLKVTKKISISFLVILGCSISAYLHYQFILREFNFLNSWYWFGADFPYIISNMENLIITTSSIKHPMFSSILSGPTYLFNLIFDSTITSAIVLRILFTAVQIILLFKIFINLKVGQANALLLILMFFSSSAFIFWAGAFETFAFGSVAITFVLYLCSKQEKNISLWVIASIFSFGFTITNIVIALVGAFFIFPNEKIKKLLLFLSFLILSFATFSLILYFLNTGSFPIRLIVNIYEVLANELMFINTSFSSTFYRMLSFFLNTGVITSIGVIELPWGEIVLGPVGFNYSLIGFTGLLLWIYFLVVGSWYSFVNIKNGCITTKVAIIFLIFQLIIHTIYGDFPFLYSSHFIPVFMVLVSSVFNNSPSKLNSLCALTFCILAAVSNYFIFIDSISYNPSSFS